MTAKSKKTSRLNSFVSIGRFALLLALAQPVSSAEIVSFPNTAIILHGIIYKPAGSGPFPAIVYNHGSARDNSFASDALGPMFARQGWVFFMPHRRGQGLSSSAGRYIRDEILTAQRDGGFSAAATAMIRLLETDHLSDQFAAFNWLRGQTYVRPKQIAVGGNSFGGILSLFGAERPSYCAAVDLAGGAESWALSPDLRARMIRAVDRSQSPVFFIQAGNDFDLSPSRVLASVMKKAGKPHQLKIYPPFGNSAGDGHSFAYRGAGVWMADVLAFLNQHCGTAELHR